MEVGLVVDPGAKKFRNFSKKFLRKLLKCIILAFSHYLRNHALNVRAFWTKKTLLVNFEIFLKIFDENSIEKLNF